MLSEMSAFFISPSSKSFILLMISGEATINNTSYMPDAESTMLTCLQEGGEEPDIRVIP